MKNPLAASKQLMQNYLSELLTEDVEEAQTNNCTIEDKDVTALDVSASKTNPKAPVLSSLKGNTKITSTTSTSLSQDIKPESNLSQSNLTQSNLPKGELIVNETDFGDKFKTKVSRGERKTTFQLDESAPKKVSSAEKEKLDKLLQQVSVASKVPEDKLDKVTSVKSENKVITSTPVVDKGAEVIPQVNITPEKKLTPQKIKTEKSYRNESFQAMFFDVAGLIVAVPLIELGGIHNADKTTALMGKPEWFKGVMLHREEKINVVDTALWVMPEKCSETLLDSLNYQYVIMLNNSNWGLLAEHLVDTVTLEHKDVKWLEPSSKRPWLAGLVKDRMCALLDVDALISMLDEGANISKS